MIARGCCSQNLAKKVTVSASQLTHTLVSVPIAVYPFVDLWFKRPLQRRNGDRSDYQYRRLEATRPRLRTPPWVRIMFGRSINGY